MKFELMHALRGLEDRTPHFFKVEALQLLGGPDEDGEFSAKETAAQVLTTQGDPKAVRLLKDILKLT